MILLKDQFYTLLSQELNPLYLEIIDDTSHHKGHREASGSSETHFTILIVSQKFQSLNRIERHRAIYNILEKYLKSQIHALCIKPYTPQEYEKISQTKVASVKLPSHI